MEVLHCRWQSGGGLSCVLISDNNSYIRCSTSICPYAGVENSSLEEYFSTSLESVQKDVECTFDILKKRWQVLNDGLHYCDIRTCERVFNACCCIHNLMLELMERNCVRVRKIGNQRLNGYEHSNSKSSRGVLFGVILWSNEGG